MGVQIGAGFEKFVIKLQVQVMSLEVHDEKNGGNGTGKFVKSIKHVLSLSGDTFSELVAMILG